MGRLEGKLAMVTGAASGLGFATSLAMAKEGARLVLVDWDGLALVTAMDVIHSSTGAEVDAVQGDASDEATVEAAFAAADRLGRLDVMFNNAGIDPLPATTVVGTTVEDFDRIMRVNVRSVFLFSRQAILRFREAGGGVIVNTASIAGLMACPAEAIYATSKAAIVNMTRAMALDHAKENIRANAFCPGVMEAVMADRRAEMTPEQLALRHASEAGSPMGRAGRYDELARAILFLATDDSSYCNGTALVADGGMISGYSGHGTTVWSLENNTRD
jgi:NAD(P)-dependent dehydrogenase (short-subunit alcohol dehydrogenase family)